MKTKIGEYEFDTHKVVEALDAEDVADILDSYEARSLAGKLPTEVLTLELDCRTDVYEGFLKELYWKMMSSNVDLETALHEVAAENGCEWPMRTAA